MMSALGLGEEEEEESPWDSEVLAKTINEGAYFLTYVMPLRDSCLTFST